MIFPSKFSTSTVFAIIGLLSISIAVQTAPNPAPNRSLGVRNVGICKPLNLSKSYLINGKNTGLMRKVDENWYEARDSRNNLKWTVFLKPLRIIGYKGQIGPYNAVSIVFGDTPQVFMIGEGEQCVDTLSREYQANINGPTRVTKVLHYGMDHFPPHY